MRTSRYTFVGCQMGVERTVKQDPQNPTATIPITNVYIINRDQAETYEIELSEDERKWLIKQLAGGVEMASSLREVKH